MLKMIDMYHPSILSTKFWRMSKGYMSLRMQNLIMYQITYMLRNQMSHPLFIITYHHHLNLNLTLVMLFQVIELHGGSILPDTQVENLQLAKFLIPNLLCKRL